MKGRFLLSSNKSPMEVNVYADKSSVILDWLLRVGITKKNFSLREIAKDISVSIGLVQRVLGVLVLQGVLQTEGIRTAKRFFMNKPHLLMKSWINRYSISQKCTMRTYRSSLENKTELLTALKKSGLFQGVVLALHSAAEAHGYKNTNLNTLELYVIDPKIRPKLEETLQLEPQEKGYEVLLIEPYYKSLLGKGSSIENMLVSSPLLTFLDLYHYPLRGLEQAEFMADRVPELKRILKRTER